MAIGAAGSVLAYAGGSASYEAARYHFDVWQLHRGAMAQVLEVAPRVEPGTVIVLTNVPKDEGPREHDPFGHNMWFDVALRLAYPRTPVAGLYYYSGGTPSPGANLVAHDDRWTQEQVETGFPTLIAEAPFSNTVIVRYSEAGRPTLLRRVPDFVDAGIDGRPTYAPLAVIQPGRPSPVALRRYGE